MEVCDFDPGFEVAATIACTLRTLVRVWRGDASWEAAMHAGDVAIDAPSDVSRAIPTWLGQSIMAARPLSAA